MTSTAKKSVEPRDQVSFKIPASTKNRIEQLAEATGRTKTFVIEEAINQYILRNEWQIQSIRKGQRDLEEGKVVPQEKFTNQTKKVSLSLKRTRRRGLILKRGE